MTLDTSKPEDTVQVSELPGYIRANRVEINSVSGSGNVGVTELELPLLATTITIPSQLGVYGYEVVLLTAAGAVTISTMNGGTQGQVKQFVFLDNLVDITDDPARGDGAFDLNQAPGGSDFSPTQYSTLTVVNVGGDGGATSNGYWREIDRAANV